MYGTLGVLTQHDTHAPVLSSEVLEQHLVEVATAQVAVPRVGAHHQLVALQGHDGYLRAGANGFRGEQFTRQVSPMQYYSARNSILACSITRM